MEIRYRHSSGALFLVPTTSCSYTVHRHTRCRWLVQVCLLCSALRAYQFQGSKNLIVDVEGRDWLKDTLTLLQRTLKSVYNLDHNKYPKDPEFKWFGR